MSHSSKQRAPRPFPRLRRILYWLPRIVLLIAIASLVYYDRTHPGNGRRGGPERRGRGGEVGRLARVRVVVDPGTVWVDDGDTIRISWPDAPAERVRVLGIDAPEVANARYPDHKEQPYGAEAKAFARRVILGARRLELLRAPKPDRYDRTLGYLFVDGVNYSVLAVENHMAESTVDRFGDNGFPEEAAQVREAARRAGPPPFESPVQFRDRTTGRKRAA
ncbi:MAG: thermonuclease family protein [Paludisphaera borealis]|uniref:thermonuclease family protein n=1 Tax=Paludisphaera borealis TaxID=1387353 RepID=UPI002842B835|nr:thermonuclease family protein [Paludisphaera borealis]MDR3622193.1 thermonuclease family protein [Paludisphaera borealis]